MAEHPVAAKATHNGDLRERERERVSKGFILQDCKLKSSCPLELKIFLDKLSFAAVGLVLNLCFVES